MNVSALSSSPAVDTAAQLPKAAATPTPAAPAAPASLPTDTVTLSHAAKHPAASGDIDHDGDSH